MQQYTRIKPEYIPKYVQKNKQTYEFIHIKTHNRNKKSNNYIAHSYIFFTENEKKKK